MMKEQNSPNDQRTLKSIWVHIGSVLNREPGFKISSGSNSSLISRKYDEMMDRLDGTYQIPNNGQKE